MTREHAAHLTGLWVAQEARKREGWTTDCAATAATVDTDQRAGRMPGDEATVVAPDKSRTQPSPPITLPWPPSGNSAVRHAGDAHYLRPEILTYRAIVADLCARYAPVPGKYRLHVHMSPPDARRRDADNALKTLLDALVKAGHLKDDSLNFMRELLVTVDDDRLGHVRVEARAA